MTTATTTVKPANDIASVHTLLAGFALGIAGDLLLWEGNIAGPGMSIWVALLAIATWVLNRNTNLAWQKTLMLWSCVAFATTLVLIFRATEELIPLCMLVLAVCAATVLMQASGTRLLLANIVDYLRALMRLPVQVLQGIWPLLGQVQLRDASVSARVRGVTRGLLLVAPLLIVYMLLFSSADVTFARHASNLAQVLSLDLPQHILVTIVLSWFATGLLICTYQRGGDALLPNLRDGNKKSQATNISKKTLGDEETAVIMGSLAALFILFVIPQASYLFGGRELIEQTSGLTVAEYARRGFFELLVVSVLTLAVLMLMSSLQCNQRIFRPLALVLAVCVLLILGSAAQRLALYTDAYGLTLLRVMAIAFMVWLAVNLLSFSVTVLRGRHEGFASGLVHSGVIAVLLLGTINPAAVVARVNLERLSPAHEMKDADYLLQLGPDAVPALLKKFQSLPLSTQCFLASNLLHTHRNAVAEQGDWRTWSASQTAARKAVEEHAGELLAVAWCERYILNSN